jgi:hypothetical protein
MAFATVERVPRQTYRNRVRPSISSGSEAQAFALEQELKPFGAWTGAPIWVPPKDCSTELAKAMLKRYGLLASREKSWAGLVAQHRSKFTQVREFKLYEASIRLPKGKILVSVTQRDQFHTITDQIPDCVRTRLDEFLAGPGSQPGVRVYYLKPLCVEVNDDLVFTTPQELAEVIAKIQEEVFAQYRRFYLTHRPGKWALKAFDAALALPRRALRWSLERRKRIIDACETRAEFERRKIALKTARMHRRCRTDGCTFEEILALTNPIDRTDVIQWYATEQEYSQAQTQRLAAAATVTLPWFFSMPLGIYYLAQVAMLTMAPPVMVCDPAFVAEMPGAEGVLLKIGHFDEVRGVVHVEI